jgi:hypothetical protein
MRASEKRARISTQLVEAESGKQIWTQRFDAELAETFDLQNEIALQIIRELEPELTRAELTLIRRQRPDNANPLDDCTLKNMAGVAAAKFVRQSCLGQISAPIPLEELASAIATAEASMGKGQFDNSNQYQAPNLGAGGYVTGLPPDPATYLQIKPFSTVTFSVAIREPNLPLGKWKWDILSAKGYLASQ